MLSGLKPALKTYEADSSNRIIDFGDSYAVQEVTDASRRGSGCFCNHVEIVRQLFEGTE